MQSGEMFRKLNNFTDVSLVCDDGSVTKGLVLHFFINILVLFSEFGTQRQTNERKQRKWTICQAEETLWLAGGQEVCQGGGLKAIWKASSSLTAI